MSDAFDHDHHLQTLDEAEQFLLAEGKEKLAGAVRRARSIHIDMTGRMAEARRTQERLVNLSEKIAGQARQMGEYVTQARGPWIGLELYPKGWPDGK